MNYSKEIDDAYWDQREHPALVEAVCHCGEPHLNDPLANDTLCPSCMKEFICIGHGVDPDST